MFDPKSYPTEPVNPKEFVARLSKYFEKIEVVNTRESLEVNEQLCGLLNLSITNPQVQPIMDKNIWAFPAQTGVGKSVALQGYLTMLQKESSLIVVATKEDARNYCSQINEMQPDSNYAKCFYKPSNKSEQHPSLLHELEELPEARCLVVTHNRFISINQSDELEFFSQYKPEGSRKSRRRDLIVIDERLALHKVFSLTTDEFQRLTTFVDNALKNSPAAKAICSHDELAKPLVAINEFIQSRLRQLELIEHIEGTELFANVDEKQSDQLNLDLLNKVTKARIDEIFDELSMISNSRSESYVNSVNKTLNSILLSLQRTLLSNDNQNSSNYDDHYNNFVLFKTNQESYLLRVKNLYSKLGTCVVLDATASFNSFYQLAHKKQFSSIVLAPAPQFRQYKNLTIFKAKGFKQSRDALYASEDADFYKNAEMYMSYAKSELKEDDQMLIVCHKEFKSYLEDEWGDPDDTRIAFTHWGNHIGKNEWNEFNKVMIVGWNYPTPLNNLAKVLATGMGTSDIQLIRKIDKELLDQFKISQLADDLVQAVMRCRARKIATADSDCLEASIYLFYPEREDSRAVLDLFESQFPQATIVDWTPKGIEVPKKKTKPQKNADRVIDLLDDKFATHETILRKDVEEELNINKSTMTRILKNEYFKQKLVEHGFDFKNKDGKSQYFILK
jgi:hypothetical protein